MKFKQGNVFGLALVGAVLASAPEAMAQSYPSRPITIVVPFGVGSGTDLVARVLGAHMAETLGQSVIIENVAGAGGMTGVARVTHAEPDGYQVVVGGVDTLAINQTLYKKPLYNSATDFEPVVLMTEQPVVLIARNDLPASDLKSFIEYAKANQSKMQFGSSGLGSGSHLACARLNAAIGAEPTHVPYRGSAQAMQDMMAGRIDYFCALGAAAVAPLESKTVKAVAILTKERSPLFPELASAHEQGLTDFDSYFWSGILLPKGTPADIVKKLHDAGVETLNTPSTQERLKKAGTTVVGADRRSAAYFKTFVEKEIAQWAATIKASSVSLD